jgi:hypothetical protein
MVQARRKFGGAEEKDEWLSAPAAVAWAKKWLVTL